MRCHTASLGIWFPTFRQDVLLSLLGSKCTNHSNLKNEGNTLIRNVENQSTVTIQETESLCTTTITHRKNMRRII